MCMVFSMLFEVDGAFFEPPQRFWSCFESLPEIEGMTQFSNRES